MYQCLDVGSHECYNVPALVALTFLKRGIRWTNIRNSIWYKSYEEKLDRIREMEGCGV